MRKQTSQVPVNTIDQAVNQARILSQELHQEGSPTRRSLKIFASLTNNKLEALTAFIIWKAKGENMTNLIKIMT